jgi:hypothetical protein
LLNALRKKIGVADTATARFVRLNGKSERRKTPLSQETEWRFYSASY